MVDYEDQGAMYENLKVQPVYKRSNHLKEKINQKLSNIKNKIPDEVIEKIKTQMKRSKITDMSSITPEDIRSILKKLGLVKYYDVDYYIFTILTGTKIIEFDQNLINNLEEMFCKVQDAFNEIKNKGRTSMFIYTYTIHKLLEILDLHIYKQFFKPPKDPEKINDYDRLWQKICIHLDWKFIPTKKII